MLRFHIDSSVVFDRRGRSNAGIRDEDVDAAELDAGFGEGRNDGVFFGHVELDAAHRICAVLLDKVFLAALKRRLVDIGKHHAGALAHQTRSRRAADAAGAAGDEGNAAGQALRLRHALQLGLFEQPIFDVEGFLLRQALIFGDRRRAAHHVDGVDVKFAGDAGRRLVAGKGQHADARHQEDHRIGVAHGRRIVVLAGVVIARIVGAVVFQRLVEAGNDCIDIGLCRIEIDDQRADLGAQEVVRAAGAERTERPQILRIDEFQHRVLIVEMAELALLLADTAANFRHQPGGDGPALRDRQALDDCATEDRLAFGLGRQTMRSPC